jgi:serine protease Do
MIEILIAAIVGFFSAKVTMSAQPDPGQIRKEYGESVVYVYANGTQGSGFQVEAPSGHDYIVTNHHVCDNAKSVVVVDEANKRVRRDVVAISNRTDLCLIEGLESLNGLTVADDWDLDELMIALSHPYGDPLTISYGYASGYANITFSESGDTLLCVTVNLKITPGSSGGPVLNKDGEVVGVVVGMAHKTKFAVLIPLQELQLFLMDK